MKTQPGIIDTLIDTLPLSEAATAAAFGSSWPQLPSDLKQANAKRILKLLFDSGPLSRADIARSTGTSKPTISKLIGEMLDLGLLTEGAELTSSGGRKGTEVRIGPGKFLSLVFCVGRDVTVAHLLDPQGRDYASVRQFRTAGGSEVTRSKVKPKGNGKASADEGAICDTSVFDQWIGFVNETIADTCTRHHLLGIGFSIPGLLHESSSLVELCPNLPWLNGRILNERLRSPLAQPPLFIQEIRALALAIRRRHTEERHYMVVDWQDGLGGAFYLEEDLHRGGMGRSGEIGHIRCDESPDARPCGCGRRGCLETLLVEKNPQRLQAGLTALVRILAETTALFDLRSIFLTGRFTRLTDSQWAELVRGYRERSFPSPARLDRRDAARQEGVLHALLTAFLQPATSASRTDAADAMTSTLSDVGLRINRGRSRQTKQVD